VVASAQEGMHSIECKKMPAVVMKLARAKAYNKVNWLHLRLLLVQLGMRQQFVDWIMGCLSSASFSMLINGSPLGFFNASQSLRKGCPLSPFLFLLVAEGLSMLIKNVMRKGALKRIKFSDSMVLSHFLFVDDIMIFGHGSLREISCLNEILDTYCKATRMEINIRKSSMLCYALDERENF
jgi:hypothetical protein